MDKVTHKFDVAFSFLAEDEALAVELNDLLQGAARLTRAMEFEARRRTFLASTEGVNAAIGEAQALSDELQALVDHESVKAIRVHHKRENIYTILLLENLGLSVAWQYHHSNTLQDSKLSVILWKGHPPFRGILQWDEPQQLSEQNFLFDLSRDEHTHWVDSGGRAFSTKELAGHIVKYYLDQISGRIRREH